MTRLRLFLGAGYVLCAPQAFGSSRESSGFALVAWLVKEIGKFKLAHHPERETRMEDAGTPYGLDDRYHCRSGFFI